MDFTSGARGLGLKVAMGEGDVRETLTTYITHCSMGEGPFLEAHDYFSLLSNFTSDNAEDEKAPQQVSHYQEKPKLFHRDENGKVTGERRKERDADTIINLTKAVKGGLDIPMKVELGKGKHTPCPTDHEDFEIYRDSEDKRWKLYKPTRTRKEAPRGFLRIY